MATVQNPTKIEGLDVTLRLTSELNPNPKNARLHSEQQVDELVASVENFGWTNPILIADEMVIAGHGRLMAAQKIYTTKGTIGLPNGRDVPFGTVPTIDCSGWSEDEKRAYTLADNKLALNADWDMNLLSAELEALHVSDFNLSLTGFSGDEASSLFMDLDEAKDAPDDFPDASETDMEHKCPKCGFEYD